jgi:hypothetical protein
MSVVGMTTSGAGQPHDGVARDADEAARLSDAATLVEVLEDGEGLVLRHAAVEQRGPLAFGEAGLAGPAVEQPDVVVLAVAVADGEIAVVALLVGGAVGILAAEAGEVVHSAAASRQAGWVEVRGIGSEVVNILRPLIVLCSVIPGYYREFAKF